MEDRNKKRFLFFKDRLLIEDVLRRLGWRQRFLWGLGIQEGSGRCLDWPGALRDSDEPVYGKCLFCFLGLLDDLLLIDSGEPGSLELGHQGLWLFLEGRLGVGGNIIE